MVREAKKKKGEKKVWESLKVVYKFILSREVDILYSVGNLKIIRVRISLE